MAHILPLEFDLHVSKRPGANGRPDQFTIAIWDGVLTLRSIGHILAMDEALATLRQIFESAGVVRSQAVAEPN